VNLIVLSHNLDRASFRQRIEIYIDTFRKNGIECEVAELPSDYFTRWKLFKRVADFDGVLLQKKCLNFYDAFWLRKRSRKIIYDLDDAVMYSPTKPDSDRTSHFKLFRRTAKLADMVVAGNAYLAEQVRRFNHNVEILPTGLDVGAYKVKTNRGNDGKVRLVWIGSRSTLKYLAEIKPVLEKIGSRFDNVVLRLVCDEFFDLEHMAVEKHLWSLETQAVDLVTSDIGLAPLLDNRFTKGKCGFKILQYAAAGLPTITSPVGVNSDYVQDGVTGFIASDTYEWVDRITRLIGNPYLRKSMGKESLSKVKSFDIGIIGEKFANLITKCLHDITS